MILTIPYQNFKIGNIHLTPFQLDRYGKTIARLSYRDGSLDFHDVSILSPPLTIVDYNSDTSRLRLDLSEHCAFQAKINILHEYLISTFFIHQQTLLHRADLSYEAVRRLFYFLLDGYILSLFIYPTITVKKESGDHCRVCDLKKGDVIRCVIRIQGISQIINREELRMRLHHSIPSIWFVAPSPLQTLGSSSIILQPPSFKLLTNPSLMQSPV